MLLNFMMLCLLLLVEMSKLIDLTSRVLQESNDKSLSDRCKMLKETQGMFWLSRMNFSKSELSEEELYKVSKHEYAT